MTPSSAGLLEKLRNEVEENLTNEQFGVEELSEAVGMSRSNLHRRLQEATGQSISQFIREYRLEKAMELLHDEEITASEVAYRVGFASATYFSKSFTDFYGYPPGEARNRKEDTSATDQESEPQAVNTNRGTIILLVLVVLALVVVFFYDPGSEQPSNIETASIEPKSIAVLPFKNQSADAENQYFADGVMDAILNKLTKVGEISVTSRTSVEKFRSVSMTVPEIASELNVSYILEGSAQKYGDNIKITTQLIKASTDDHLWSEEYTRKFEDVLSLQGEIAERVAGELRTVLTQKEKEQLQRLPTTEPRAYDYFLLADFQFNKSTQEGLEKAISLYELAIEADPNFADAYVGLAENYWIGGLVWGIYAEQEAWSKIQPLLMKALEIDPSNGQAYQILANAVFYYTWDFESARKYYEQSMKSSGHNGNPDFFIKMGDLDLAQQTNEIHISREPTVAYHQTFKAEIHYHQGDKDIAIQTLDHANQLFDDHYFLRETAKLYYNFGEIAKSKEAFEKVRANFLDRPPLFHWLEAVLNLAEGMSAQESFDQLTKLYEEGSSGSPAWFLAMYHAVTGDRDKVFEWLEVSHRQHEVEMTWLKMEPLLVQYRQDPRYIDLLNRMGFPQ